MAMTAKIIGTKGKQKLVVEIDMQEPTPSGSGKTLVVASTHGNATTETMVDGKPLVIGLNAYVRNAK